MVAVSSYVGSLKQLLLCGAGLALCMVAVQASTGWKGVIVKEEESGGGSDGEEEVNGREVNGREVDDEEWEEGIEQGV